MFGTFGFTELILILVIVLIIFGAGKLPQLGEGLGKAIKGFKKSVNEAESMEVETQMQTQGDRTANSDASSAQIPASSQNQAMAVPSQSNESTTQVSQSEAVSNLKA
jgi:sec-independent protein translocase protein TatA